MALRAADIPRICAQGHGHLIDLVRDFDTHTKVSRRIYLKTRPRPTPFHLRQRGIPERAQPNRRYGIAPASLSAIVSHQLIERLTRIVQCSIPGRQAEPPVAIVFPR